MIVPTFDPDELIALMIRRPKIALRRTSDPVLRCAINEYQFNRKRKLYAEIALENVRRILRRG